MCLNVIEETYRGGQSQLGVSIHDKNVYVCMDKTTHMCIDFISSSQHLFLTHIVSVETIQYHSHCHERTDIPEECYGRPLCVLSYLLSSFLRSSSPSVFRLRFQGDSFSLLALVRKFAHCLSPLFIMSSRGKIRRVNAQEDYFVAVIRFPGKINWWTLLTVQLFTCR